MSAFGKYVVHREYYITLSYYNTTKSLDDSLVSRTRGTYYIYYLCFIVFKLYYLRCRSGRGPDDILLDPRRSAVHPSWGDK